jgi:hypothetical protein
MGSRFVLFNSMTSLQTKSILVVFDMCYDHDSATYHEQAYQQMLIIFDVRNEDTLGVSIAEAIACFKSPVGPEPLNDRQQETKKLFDYIVDNFETLHQALLVKGFIQTI